MKSPGRPARPAGRAVFSQLLRARPRLRVIYASHAGPHDAPAEDTSARALADRGSSSKIAWALEEDEFVGWVTPGDQLIRGSITGVSRGHYPRGILRDGSGRCIREVVPAENSAAQAVEPHHEL